MAERSLSEVVSEVFAEFLCGLPPRALQELPAYDLVGFSVGETQASSDERGGLRVIARIQLLLDVERRPGQWVAERMPAVAELFLSANEDRVERFTFG